MFVYVPLEFRKANIAGPSVEISRSEIRDEGIFTMAATGVRNPVPGL